MTNANDSDINKKPSSDSEVERDPGTDSQGYLIINKYGGPNTPTKKERRAAEMHSGHKQLRQLSLFKQPSSSAFATTSSTGIPAIITNGRPTVLSTIPSPILPSYRSSPFSPIASTATKDHSPSVTRHTPSVSSPETEVWVESSPFALSFSSVPSPAPTNERTKQTQSAPPIIPPMDIPPVIPNIGRKKDNRPLSNLV